MESNSTLNRVQSSFVVKIPPPLIQKLSTQNINGQDRQRLFEKQKNENMQLKRQSQVQPLIINNFYLPVSSSITLNISATQINGSSKNIHNTINKQQNYYLAQSNNQMVFNIQPYLLSNQKSSSLKNQKSNSLKNFSVHKSNQNTQNGSLLMKFKNQINQTNQINQINHRNQTTKNTYFGPNQARCQYYGNQIIQQKPIIKINQCNRNNQYKNKSNCNENSQKKSDKSQSTKSYLRLAKSLSKFVTFDQMYKNQDLQLNKKQQKNKKPTIIKQKSKNFKQNIQNQDILSKNKDILSKNQDNGYLQINTNKDQNQQKIDYYGLPYSAKIIPKYENKHNFNKNKLIIVSNQSSLSQQKVKNKKINLVKQEIKKQIKQLKITKNINIQYNPTSFFYGNQLIAVKMKQNEMQIFHPHQNLQNPTNYDNQYMNKHLPSADSYSQQYTAGFQQQQTLQTNSYSLQNNNFSIGHNKDKVSVNKQQCKLQSIRLNEIQLAIQSKNQINFNQGQIPLNSKKKVINNQKKPFDKNKLLSHSINQVNKKQSKQIKHIQQTQQRQDTQLQDISQTSIQKILLSQQQSLKNDTQSIKKYIKQNKVYNKQSKIYKQWAKMTTEQIKVNKKEKKINKKINLIDGNLQIKNTSSKATQNIQPFSQYRHFKVIDAKNIQLARLQHILPPQSKPYLPNESIIGMISRQNLPKNTVQDDLGMQSRNYLQVGRRIQTINGIQKIQKSLNHYVNVKGTPSFNPSFYQLQRQTQQFLIKQDIQQVSAVSQHQKRTSRQQQNSSGKMIPLMNSIDSLEMVSSASIGNLSNIIFRNTPLIQYPTKNEPKIISIYNLGQQKVQRISINKLLQLQMKEDKVLIQNQDKYQINQVNNNKLQPILAAQSCYQSDVFTNDTERNKFSNNNI